MKLFLQDDKGTLHPVETNLRPDACQDLINKAKVTCAGVDGWPPIMARVGKTRNSKQFYAV